MLIYVIDATELKLCLLLSFFFLPDEGGNPQAFVSQRWVVSNPAGIGRLRD
jgi:hypothetical protein